MHTISSVPIPSIHPSILSCLSVKNHIYSQSEVSHEAVCGATFRTDQSVPVLFASTWVKLGGLGAVARLCATPPGTFPRGGEGARKMERGKWGCVCQCTCHN